ncbi:uncharacterized protein LOC127856396 isoform X2 [Dreissena polymorpha]|uniref:uncharacterized protein LOC127856396 isoform X2 n=1 Tax=Dreissena polymorpha TaxID=45954 RepID=UPI002264A020|nr:uncharacterized protein LOC127856396 isoform X2 [Dreissena polymorpha]
MAETFSYRNSISTFHAITWSKDNRIAFCTDNSINCLTLSPDVTIANTKPRFVQTLIPSEKEVWDIPQYSIDDHIKFINHLPRELFSEMSADAVMNPFEHFHDSVARRGFKQCVWSPLGMDPLERSILATLSHDHRLCIFSQMDSFIKWQKVAELSLLRCEGIPPPDSCRETANYEKYRDWCYSHISTAVDWYDCLVPGSDPVKKCALLASGMYTGRLVLWRIDTPLRDKSGCSIIQEVDSVHTKQVKCMKWAPDIGALAVAYVDGRVYLLTFDLRCYDSFTIRPRTLCIHGDSDLMPVSSMIYLPQKNESYWLLVNKEQYYLLYLLQHDGNHGDVKVTYSSHLTLDCGLHSAGVFVLDSNIVVTISVDAAINKILLYTETQGISIDADTETQDSKVETVAYQLSTDNKHLCLGACISPNKLMVAYVCRPRPGFDHLADITKRRYTYVTLKWIEEANLESPNNVHCIDRLLDISVSLGEADILERYRQSLFVPDLNVTLTLLDERARSSRHGDGDSLLQSELRVLQLKRYNCLVMTNCLRNKILAQLSPLDRDKEKLASQEALLSQFTRHAVALHCIQSLQNYVKGNNSNQDHHRVAALMLQYIEKHSTLLSDRLRQETAVLHKSVETRANREAQAVKCAICAANLTLTDTFTWQCSGGHTLATCPMTILPCELVDYITCSTCKAAVQHPDVIRSFPWIAGNAYRCSLCEERLAVT